MCVHCVSIRTFADLQLTLRFPIFYGSDSHSTICLTFSSFSSCDQCDQIINVYVWLSPMFSLSQFSMSLLDHDSWTRKSCTCTQISWQCTPQPPLLMWGLHGSSLHAHGLKEFQTHTSQHMVHSNNHYGQQSPSDNSDSNSHPTMTMTVVKVRAAIAVRVRVTAVFNMVNRLWFYLINFIGFCLNFVKQVKPRNCQEEYRARTYCISLDKNILDFTRDFTWLAIQQNSNQVTCTFAQAFALAFAQAFALAFAYAALIVTFRVGPTKTSSPRSNPYSCTCMLCDTWPADKGVVDMFKWDSVHTHIHTIQFFAYTPQINITCFW